MMSKAPEGALAGMVEDALVRIKSLVELLFETAEDAIFLMDGMQFVDCNPATLKMFGCRSKASVVGRTPVDFSPALQPDGRPSAELAERYIAAALGGAPQHFEWRHCQLEDAKVLDVEVRLSRFEVKEVPFLVAVVRDVTVRKQADAELRLEKQFSECLTDSLPGIFYLYDSDLRLRRWNKKYEDVTGYAADELEGVPLGAFAPNEARRRETIAAARRILEFRAPEFLEIEFLRKDGSSTVYLCSGVRLDSAAGPMILGVGIDIEARIRAERELAASEQRLRELFNATSEALFIHDDTGRVVDINERARIMFGIDVSDVDHLVFEALSLGESPYSQAEARERIAAALSDGPQLFEWRSRRMDGSVFWTEVALRAYRTGGERRVIAAVRDITERKRAEAERERLVAVQAAIEAKDQFLAMLSHELRTPMSAIRAGVELLCESELNQDPRVSRALELIKRNVDLQARYVEDLLDHSRLERGKLTVHRAPVRLDQIVHSASDTCTADAESAEVELVLQVEPNLWIEADRDRIEQVVVNLIGNAIKFTPKGGRVTVSASVEGELARVVVEDTGVGIEVERLKHVFDLFQQGPALALRAPGLGIGLALVRSIVELHGGRVWVASEGPGRGSRFGVELRLCEPHNDHVERAP